MLSFMNPITDYNSDSFIDFNGAMVEPAIEGCTQSNVLKVETDDGAAFGPYSGDYSYLSLMNACADGMDTKDWEAEWKSKNVSDWNETDVLEWVYDEIQNAGYVPPQFPVYLFREMKGRTLMQMTKDDFYNILHCAIDQKETANHCAHLLYECLQEKLGFWRYDPHSEESVVPVPVMDKYTDVESMHGSESNTQDNYVCLDMDKISHTEYNHHYSGSKSYRDYDSCSNEYDIMHASPASKPSLESDSEKSVDLSGLVKVKRPPGRPKGSGKKVHKRAKNVSIPEFLRDLLLNPETCPKLIKWEDYSIGKFRFVDAAAVANLWGEKRANKTMSFEKLSRAMRYHYKQKVLLSVPTTRLVYQFGPNMQPIRTENPNFERCGRANDS